MNKRTKNLEKGITLIALVITIIVLLILAGISIAMLTGDNGILTKGAEAKQTNEQKSAEEQVKIAIMGSYGQDGKINLRELKENLNRITEITGVPSGDITDFPFEVIVDGQKVEINKIGETVTAVEKGVTTPSTPEEPVVKTALENAETAIPTGASIKEGTTEDTGIVMIDSNGNEWVWVEVPSTVFTTATSATDYTNIKADLIAYATNYREGKTGQGRYWTDEWYDYYGTTYDGENEYSQIKYITSSTYFSGAKRYYGTIYTDSGVTEATSYTSGTTYYAKITEKLTDISGCGLTYNDYKTNYEKMLSSIYNNKGFYISRYEIGDSTATESNTTRTSSSGTTGKAVSKVDQIPYNYVTCGQAQGLASGMATGDKTSSLLFGIQWDLVCKFLEVKSDLEVADIKTNSTSWGNYKNSSLTLKSGKYNTDPNSSSSVWTAYNVDTTNYVTDSQTNSNTNYYQLLTTGASDDTKVMNIYDFTGNALKYTLEHATTDTTYPCSLRGGYYCSSAPSCPASYRGCCTSGSGGDNYAFRSSLY